MTYGAEDYIVFIHNKGIGQNKQNFNRITLNVGSVRRKKILNSVGSEKMFSSFRQYISHNNICILRTEEPVTNKNN